MDKEQLIEALTEALNTLNIGKLSTLLDQAGEEYPEEVFTYSFSGEYYLITGDYNLAEINFKAAIKAEPDNLKHHTNFAHALANNGNPEKAKSLFEKVAKKDPKNMEAHVALGLISMNEGEVEKAIDHFSTVIEQDDSSIDALSYRAQLYASEDEYEKALADLDRIIELEPHNHEALYARINLYSIHGHNDKAKAEYLRLVEAYPEDLAMRSAYIDFLMEIEDHAEAAKQLDWAIDKQIEELGEASVDLYEQRAWVRFNNQELGAALADAKKAMELDGKTDTAYLIAANINLAQDDPKGALLYLKVGLDLVYPEWRLRKKRGEIFMDNNQLAEAEKEFKKILDDPNFEAEGHYLLGCLHHQKNDLDMAFAHWDKANDLGQLDAIDMIEEHCQEQIKAQEAETEDQLIEEYQEEYPKNEACEGLQFAFGKIWKLDAKTTKSKNDILSSLPADQVKGILENVGSGFLAITPTGVYMYRPGDDDIRDVYKVEDEKGGKVEIESQPLYGGPAQQLFFSNKGKHLLFSVDPKGELTLYLSETPYDKLGSKDQKALDAIVAAGDIDFMGDDFKATLK